MTGIRDRISLWESKSSKDLGGGTDAPSQGGDRVRPPTARLRSISLSQGAGGASGAPNPPSRFPSRRASVPASVGRSGNGTEAETNGSAEGGRVQSAVPFDMRVESPEVVRLRGRESGVEQVLRGDDGTRTGRVSGGGVPSATTAPAATALFPSPAAGVGTDAARDVTKGHSLWPGSTVPACSTCSKVEKGTGARKVAVVESSPAANLADVGSVRGQGGGPQLTREESRRLPINTDHWSNVPLDEGVVYLLKAGDVPEDEMTVVRERWLGFFEDKESELVRVIERYPRLIHKFPKVPELCYGIIRAWEDGCLAKLTAFELEKHWKVICSHDVVRAESVEGAQEGAAKKYSAFVLAREELARKEREKKERQRRMREIRGLPLEADVEESEKPEQEKDEMIKELESNKTYLRRKAELEALQCKLLGRVLVQGS